MSGTGDAIGIDPTELIDPFSVLLARAAGPPLREFNDSGVLSAADVHVAMLLGALAGVEHDGDVLLAAALAVRAPRIGHVFVDLASIAQTASVESDEQLDLGALPWPEPGRWVSLVAGSDVLVACGEPAEGLDDTTASALAPAGESGAADNRELRPLRLIGTRLYLDRYWREERQVAEDLRSLDAAPIRHVEIPLLADGLQRMFGGDGDQLQRVAAACAVLRSLAVVAGGPGTGKTTTVAKIIALLHEQARARDQPPPLVALAAPTGKAAARLQESVHTEAARLAAAPEVRDALLALRASTIHRLLGWRPGSHSRFRHDRGNRLPHDVVIVDETSMVSLTLMARLLEAVRGDARVVLVGDPEQLTAIEAGAVLRDVVGPAASGPRMSTATRVAVTRALGTDPAAMPDQGAVAFGDGIVVLKRVHRYGPVIARVAGAIRSGDADEVMAALRAGTEEVVWIVPDGTSSLEPVRNAAVDAGRAVIEAARRGDGAAALGALGSFRALCAHRRGPHGVETWTDEIEQWLAEAIPGFEPDSPQYVGRPLLITRNDYELALFNGDTGVVVQGEQDRASAIFERDGELVGFAPSRLDSVQTVYAMTIHKSQGSQFDAAAVLLGDASSRILTRELLYTAVTRARSKLILVADEDAIRAAVARPVARATALRERLWGSDPQA